MNCSRNAADPTLTRVTVKRVLFQCSSDTLEKPNLKSDTNKSSTTVNISGKPIEMISVRNVKSPKKNRVARVSVPLRQVSLCTQPSSQPTIQFLVTMIETLYNQVQSLHETITILEEHLTVVEEAFRASF